MKRLIFILAILATGVASAMAQQAVAVLTHAGTTKTFDGYTALQDAYKEAASGDLITLSSGTFASVATIEKALTIRGAGMEYDSIYHTQATILEGDITLDVPQSESGHFQLEGIWHDNVFYYTHVQNNPQFTKCRLKSFKYAQYSELGSNYIGRVVNAHFFQCKIVFNLDCQENCSISCINCYVGHPYTWSETTSTIYLQNCLVSVYTGAYSYSNISYGTNYSSQLYGSSIKNCIFVDNNIPSLYFKDNTTFINCLFPSHSTYYKPETAKNIYQRYENIQVVFDTYTGNYTDDEDFLMRDAVKSVYCDENGSELGMYGGNFPYTPRLAGPHLKYFDAASHSTTDGKLRVRVQVDTTLE